MDTFNGSFLELGGDSLDSTLIINQVTSAFGIDIPFSVFFKALTIAEMATIIHQTQVRAQGRSTG